MPDKAVQMKAGCKAASAPATKPTPTIASSQAGHVGDEQDGRQVKQAAQDFHPNRHIAAEKKQRRDDQNPQGRGGGACWHAGVMRPAVTVGQVAGDL